MTIFSLLLCVFLHNTTVQAAPLTENEQAKVWFDQGQTDKALSLLRKVWLRDKSYGAGISYAYYLAQAKRYDESIDIFQKVIRSFPKKYDADVELATVYKSINDFEKAEKVLLSAYNRGGSKNYKIINAYASVLLYKKEYDKAIDLLAKYTPKENEELQYLNLWASVHFEAGNYEIAAKTFEELVSKDPQNHDAQYSLARCYRKLLRFFDAENIYNLLQMENGDDPVVYYERGLSYFDQQYFDKAIEQFTLSKNLYTAINNTEKAHVAQQLLYEALEQKGRKLLAEGDFGRACSIFYDIYEGTEDLRSGLLTAGCYQGYNNFESANLIYKKLVKKYPSNVDIYVNAYEVLLQLKRFDEARDLMFKYTDNNTVLDTRIATRLASSYLALKKYEEALNTIEQAEKHINTEQQTLSLLFIKGLILRDSGRNDDAKQVLEQAIRLAPDLLDTRLELFDIAQTQGDHGYSGLLLMEAYEQFGLTPKILLKRAVLNFSVGDWHAALADCETILQDPAAQEDPPTLGGAKAIKEDSQKEIAKGLYREGKTFDAVNLFQSIYFVNPNSNNAIQLAYYRSVIGQSNRSDALFTEVLRTDPNNTVLESVWAEILQNQHRSAEVLEKIHVIPGPDHIYNETTSKLMLGALADQGEWQIIDDSLIAITQQLGNLPTDLLGYQAIVYDKQEKYDEAIAIWKELDTRKPGLPSFRLEMALLHIKKKEYTKARSVYEELLKEFPTDADVWLHWSRFLQRTNDPIGAQNAGEQCITLLSQPIETDYWGNIERRSKLADAYINIGDWDEAEQITKQILLDVPFYFSAHTKLGFIYLEKKDISKAVQYFTTASELQPKNPYALLNIALTEMKANSPGLSLYWESKTIPSVYKVDNAVSQIKSASLGVFGYRPIPWTGTAMGITTITGRPNAMMLVRESAFSDAPLAGFSVDQFVYSQKVGLFAPETPALWVNYNYVGSSGALDTYANLVDVNLHGSLKLNSGVWSVFPSGILLFENQKYSQNKSKIFPMAKIKATFIPTHSNLYFEGMINYGIQRLDKVSLPTEFFVSSVSGAWGKQQKSLFSSLTYRHDNTPSGDSFSTIITQNSGATNIGTKITTSLLLKTEHIFNLPKIGNASGIEILQGTQLHLLSDRVIPYISFDYSTSPKYEFGHVLQRDIGLTYQNTFLAPTREMQAWYTYKIPYQIQIALQQYTYPNSTIPTSQTLFFNFKVI